MEYGFAWVSFSFVLGNLHTVAPSRDTIASADYMLTPNQKRIEFSYQNHHILFVKG